MKIGIMQPYLFPYIGYFQLIKAVDIFVVHDDVQWIKGGWINRNRILFDNQVKTLTLAVKKRSNYDKINQFEVSEDHNNRNLYLNRIASAYAKAPFFKQVYPIIEGIILMRTCNLSDLIVYSLETVKRYLEIDTKIILSSDIEKNNSLCAQERVINICKSLNSATYTNPIGGMELYKKEDFAEHNLKLYFIKPDEIRYEQFGQGSIANLSIIDVLMFNNQQTIRSMLNDYILIE
ncbi:MAG: WbqC family protein [Parcubacteria group bacterium]|jgi:hypothetical protein